MYDTKEKFGKRKLQNIPVGFFVGQQLSWQTEVSTNRHRLNRQFNCSMSTTQNEPGDDQALVRRCANYGPTIWKYEYIQSLKSNYVGEDYEMKASKLKEEVKIMMLEKMDTPFQKLELIDTVKRLGVSYHFEKEIEGCLDAIYNETDWLSETFDLNEASLSFRLFRQHGYNVSPDVFNIFKDKYGNFKESLCDDTKGLLALYEASFLGFEEESIFDEVEIFATKHLKENLNKIKNPYLAMLVNHALELPLHWAMERFEARWFIDAYENRKDVNKALLNFAKLDFNMVQAIHQEDLKHASRWLRSTLIGVLLKIIGRKIELWWENFGWSKKLPFVRDRLVECYLWSLAEVYDPRPEFQYYRRMSTRIYQVTTCIDDIYDVYGTLEELELLNDAYLGWNVNLAVTLPDYMKICFLGNINLVNELGYEALKEFGIHALPYLIKAWTDLCGCYIKEARWFHGGYVPSLEEYLNNGWMSAATAVMAIHGYFFSACPSHPITEEGLKAVTNYDDIIKWPSMIVRLVNDLATSKNELKRGDILKSVQIHMHETSVSEEEAQQHIKKLVRKAWKKINAARARSDNPFSRKYVDIATNIARAAHYMYQYGDAHGHNIKGKNKDRVTLLLIEPIQLSFE
ncbi:terpene synthase 10-like [Impatiens glandulifera]|uniref:terpene synthase 10-like n=1 Tax=Impatiens glandulifera TaxID=253017 RepID=UPI001FB07B0A|nr:terpene synthase 10-like [Impatiens glandulifera]